MMKFTIPSTLLALSLLPSFSLASPLPFTVAPQSAESNSERFNSGLETAAEPDPTVRGTKHFDLADSTKPTTPATNFYSGSSTQHISSGGNIEDFYTDSGENRALNVKLQESGLQKNNQAADIVFKSVAVAVGTALAIKWVGFPLYNRAVQYRKQKNGQKVQPNPNADSRDLTDQEKKTAEAIAKETTTEAVTGAAKVRPSFRPWIKIKNTFNAAVQRFQTTFRKAFNSPKSVDVNPEIAPKPFAEPPLGTLNTHLNAALNVYTDATAYRSGLSAIYEDHLRAEQDMENKYSALKSSLEATPEAVEEARRQATVATQARVEAENFLGLWTKEVELMEAALTTAQDELSRATTGARISPQTQGKTNDNSRGQFESKTGSGVAEPETTNDKGKQPEVTTETKNGGGLVVKLTGPNSANQAQDLAESVSERQGEIAETLKAQERTTKIVG